MRLNNWRDRLRDLITERAGMVFEYGTMDCVLWSMEAYNAVTGMDPAAPYRGLYNDRRGAAEVLNGMGGSILAAVSRHIGPPTDGDPKDGDLVMVQTVYGYTMGVYADDRVVVAGRDGLDELPSSVIVYVWNV